MERRLLFIPPIQFLTNRCSMIGVGPQRKGGCSTLFCCSFPLSSASPEIKVRIAVFLNKPLIQHELQPEPV